MNADTLVRDTLLRTLPLFEMMRMRAATSARRHATLGYASDDPVSNARWVNQFIHTKRLLGPRDREVVSPNNDTLYSSAWLDLSDGPLLIDSPDMGDRYWTLGLLDAWTNPYAYVGRRTTGSRAQRTLVHGPGWRGTVPPGVSQVIAAPGLDIWIIGRILVDDDAADLARVHDLQASLRILRLDGAPAVQRVDALLDGRRTEVPEARTYASIIDTALRRNPPAPGEALRWPVAEAELAPALPVVFEELRQDAQPAALGAGWSLPVAVRAHWGEDVLTRAQVARNLIGALGIDEAMYPLADRDADGEPLTGARAYELRFAPGSGPQVDAFWSITMYRRGDCLLVDNPIDRYSIGDRTPGLRHEPGGALTLRIQADDPGAGHNWLPAPAGEPFYLVLRLYQPRAAHLEFRYAYPPVRRIR